MAEEAASHPADAHSALDEAALWYARLLPGAAELDDPKALEDEFARWLAADTQHAQAWDTIREMGQKIAQIPAEIALPTLDREPHSSRRSALYALALMAVGGGVFVGLRQAPWQRWQADYATAPGERRSVTLADGGVLELDTRTALDVDYRADERRIRLHAGTILVSTRPDTAAQARPFVVHTAHGRILALGTRFEVRAEEDATTVSVLEAAVLVSRAGRADTPIRVQAGERLRLTDAGTEPVTAAAVGIGAWTTGQLIVWDRPLGEVIAELARYRRGWLTCDPAVAALRISGVLPITDTDEALAALEDSFPVQVERQWGGWRTRIVAR